MRRLSLGLLLCASIGFGLAFAQAAKPPKEKKTPEQSAQGSDAKATAQARSLLEAAGMYLELGDKEAAEAHALEALKATQTEGLAEAKKIIITGDVRKILEKISKARQAAANKTKEDKAASDERARQKHLAQLHRAEALSSAGNNDDAEKLVQEVIGDTDDPEVLKKANAVSGRIESTPLGLLYAAWRHLLTVLGWLIDIIIGGLALVIFYGLLNASRKLNAKRWKRLDTVASDSVQGATQPSLSQKWHVSAIEDTTSLGVAGAVIESLTNWSTERQPASAGLLKLGVIQVPTRPLLVGPTLELNLEGALEDLKLDIGTVSIGGIAKAFASVRRWYNSARPSISGAAFLAGDQVVVRLTRQNANDKSETVTASAAKELAIHAAEAASFKMYYLIATPRQTQKPEAANRLREGLKLLSRYVTAGGFSNLQNAHEVFRSVHDENPSYNEAFLYEGIALDLLERHDEAVKRFEYLVDLDEIDEDLRKKAIYNKAVSRFRQYKVEALKPAIEELETLIGSEPKVADLLDDPIKAISYAAKANAIAHKPIFWQQFSGYDSRSTDDPTTQERKTEKKDDVKGWVDDVEQMAETLKDVCKTSASQTEKWDEATRQQLRWAIENACGNAFLNYAKSFLTNPDLPGAGVQKQASDYLGKALEAFQKCEMLLAPGVETLTNMATVLTELSRVSDARAYLERAIDLNPSYEYAYYRLAESWVKENRTDKVVDVLRAFARIRLPRISSFNAIYSTYAAELARPSVV